LDAGPERISMPSGLRTVLQQKLAEMKKHLAGHWTGPAGLYRA